MCKFGQVVTLATSVEELPSSRLSRATIYPEVFVVFLESLEGKYKDHALNYTTTPSLHIMSSSLFTTIRSFDTI
jgi:hypothetical protein